MKWLQRAILGASATFLLALAGCGGGAGPITLPLSTLPTLGELEAMIKASTAPDSDGDFIPDDIEKYPLGTNHLDRDSDRDGLPDNYEIFGSGLFDPAAYVPDEDQDGIIAALDKDDNADFINDGLSIDTDGDGIANYLEFYGYTYDWLTGRFVSCEDIGCDGLTVFKSDPLQRSTDQDPYSDDMEASGLGMDVSCSDPGTHPLVPAYPNLIIEFIGYAVTLNDDITFGKGGSISRGTEWTRQTTRSYSLTAEASWEGGVTVGGEIGADPKFVGNVSTSIGMKIGVTTATELSVSKTTSLTEETNWEAARSFNPTEAAHIKLLLKVHNRGSAAASNIVPTLTLRVAGLNVTTFEPGNPAINMLVPGGTYPEEDGIYWVIDRTALGEPIVLTMTELRAFEKGAPVGVNVTQLKADVMELSDEGAGERVGDISQFAARCDAVCAKIRIDPGDGTIVDRMVYAQSGPSGPVVTLGEALEWAVGMVNEPDGSKIHYFDRDGVPVKAALRDWTIVCDQETLRSNGFDPRDLAGTMPENYDMMRLVLQPDSIVLAKAPRVPKALEPVVHFAIIDEEDRIAKACATDYKGVEDLVVHAALDTGAVDANNEPILDHREWTMVESPVGSGMYSYHFGEDDWNNVVNRILEKRREFLYEGLDILAAEAISLDGVWGVGEFGSVLPNPQPVARIIDAVSVDTSNRSIYVEVKPNETYPDLWNDTFQLQWVRAYHPLFKQTNSDGGVVDGFIEMKRPPDAYKDPYGWECVYPVGDIETTDITIVAFVVPGVYTERQVVQSEVQDAYRFGNVTLASQVVDAIPILRPWNIRWFWDFEGFWSDLPLKQPVHHEFENLLVDLFVNWGWSSEAHARTFGDFYFRHDGGLKVFFNGRHKLVDAGDYDLIDENYAKINMPTLAELAAPVSPNWCVNHPVVMEVDQVFIYMTRDGRYAKLVVEELPAPVIVPIFKWGYLTAARARGTATFKYLVWKK